LQVTIKYVTELSTVEQAEKLFLLPSISVPNSVTPIDCPISIDVIMGSPIEKITSDAHGIKCEISDHKARVTSNGLQDTDMLLKITTKKFSHIYIEVARYVLLESTNFLRNPTIPKRLLWFYNPRIRSQLGKVHK
jgi:hypothetical protein